MQLNGKIISISASALCVASLFLLPLLAAPASASTLLSLNQPAVASSIQQNSPTYAPGHVTDGDLVTRWASVPGIDPQWIYVDLTANATIDRVVIKWWGDYAVAYQIQVSSDATNWTSIYSTSTGDGATDDVAVAGSGRYVRMYGTVRSNSGNNGRYSIYEMEVYGTGGGGGGSTATNTPTGPTATRTNTPTGPTPTNTPIGPTPTWTNTPIGPTATNTPVSSGGFTENWDASTSAYFNLSSGKSSATSNVADAAANDGKVLKMTLAARPRAGAGNGPEIQSPLRYQYGSYSSRLKTADCSAQPLAGVVTGYFTYFNNGTDTNGNGLPDNSEIDFEWLCAEPQVFFITMWTDYDGSPDVHKKVYREINLATGVILKTCYDEVWGECQALASSELQPTSITAIPGYNSSTAYYEYGFTWASTGVRWWVVNPANGQQITLWDYQGPAARITTVPAYYMTNVWHTNNWSPESMPTAIQQPTIPIYASVDWTKFATLP
jgi:hypothetical protein